MLLFIGLDATTAIHIMQVMKMLALHGMTIIFSLHSPRSEVWHLLNRIILIAEGSVPYYRPSQESIHYFARHGHYIEAFTNPAEFLIDLTAVDRRSRHNDDLSQERISI
jgi:ABC-type multidrug transport system ATPase subunit